MYKQHKLSLAFLTVQGCPPVDHVKIAAAADYDAAGLRLIAPFGLELAHPIVGNPALVREIKTVAADLGISFLDGEVFTLLPDTDVRSWLPIIETAAELGMPLMQITCEDGELSRAADNLGRIADEAARLNIAMAIEFMRWRATATIEDAAQLARASGRSNVGVLLDVLHLSRSGGTPAAVAALPNELILYLQLCDAAAVQPTDDAGRIAEARGGRMMPGEGALWLRELMAVLPPDVAISVETPHKGDTGLSFLERAQRGMTATRAFLSSLKTA
jgi:sugar phosphate isomerase/epimerase